MNRKKVIIISAIILMLLGGLVIWGFNRPSKKNLLQETPNLPESEWSRIVQVREGKPGYRILSNKIDGYEINVPNNWQVLETASVKGGLKAFYNTSGEYGSSEFNEGIMLNVLTLTSIDETESYFPSSARFEDQKTEVGLAYKTSYKATQDTTVNGEPVEVPIEKSLVIKYIFPSDKKVYLVSCLALGDNSSELASLCEKQILTFKIIK